MVTARELKRAAMQKRGGNLGMERVAFGEDGLVQPHYRARIVQDVNRALIMMRDSGIPIPKFVLDNDARAMNGLMGVEGFLMPPGKASYNDLKDEGFSGILQFGPVTFDSYAKKIAATLNAMKDHPMMGETSLQQAVAEAGFRDWKNFTFTPENVWLLHDNPVVQGVAGILHHQDMKGNRLAKIEELGPGKKNIVSYKEQMGLMTISHNIPALARLMMDDLEKGTDKDVNHVQVAKYAGQMGTNPGLYKGAPTLRAILAKVSDYVTEKADKMQGFTAPAVLSTAHKPPENALASREGFASAVRTAITEELKSGISDADRKKLMDMIAEINKQEAEWKKEEAPQKEPTGNPDDIIRGPGGYYRTRAAVESDLRRIHGDVPAGGGHKQMAPPGPPAATQRADNGPALDPIAKFLEENPGGTGPAKKPPAPPAKGGAAPG